MSTATPNPNVAEKRMTVEEYLAFENASELRHEYVDGKVIEMTGGTEQHFLLMSNLLFLIHGFTLTKKLEHRAYPAGMRVMVDETKHRYPDIVVSDGLPKLTATRRELLNPLLAVEILSPSTEKSDRGAKSEEYRSIETVQEYILVAQDRMRVERYAKDDEGYWQPADVYTTPTAELVLTSLGTTVSVGQIYDRVDFTTGGE